MKTTQFKIPSPPPSQILNISQFGGINLSTTPAEIADNEASDMRNFLLDTRGALDKRKGYKRLFESLGEGLINGMTIYRKSDGTEEFVFAHGTKLYKLDTDTGEYTLIYDGLADTNINFFTISDKLYMLDGVSYKVYDGATVTDVIGYIPTVYTECVPSGSGNEFEQLNLLTRGYIQNFSSDGTSTEYKLAYYPLGAETVTISYTDETGPHDLVENTNFTVDRTTGKVTLTTAIVEGVGNVNFTAYREEDNSQEILKCRVSELYGGNNDTRVFLIGSYPNRIYYSGLTTTGLNPTYFPANNVINIGATNEAITGMVKQYDTLVIIKQYSMYYMRYTTDSNGLGIFPVMPLNDTIGCISPYSIQIIENSPIFLSKNGVYVLNQSQVRDERNVTLISEKVNKMILNENLELATSIDFDSKYFLCFPSGNVYVYDYSMGVWYIWDNIKANCFIEFNKTLYFGGNGIIYRFMRVEEKESYNDDGVPIHCYWKSKLFNFGTDNMRKLIEKIFFAMKTNSRTSTDLYYYTEDGSLNYIDREIADLISYNTMDYSRSTYLCTTFPIESMKKIKVKKAIYFQIIIDNNYDNESLGLLSIDLKYRFQNYVK